MKKFKNYLTRLNLKGISHFFIKSYILCFILVDVIFDLKFQWAFFLYAAIIPTIFIIIAFIKFYFIYKKTE